MPAELPVIRPPCISKEAAPLTMTPPPPLLALLLLIVPPVIFMVAIALGPFSGRDSELPSITPPFEPWFSVIRPPAMIKAVDFAAVSGAST